MALDDVNLDDRAAGAHAVAGGGPHAEGSFRDFVFAHSWEPSLEESREFAQELSGLDSFLRCSFIEFKSLKKCMATEDFAKFAREMHEKSTPFKVVAALRANKTISTEKARTLQSQILKMMLPDLNPRTGEAPTVPKKELYRMCFESLLAATEYMPDAAGAAGDATSAECYSLQLSKAIGLEFPIHLKSLHLQWKCYGSKFASMQSELAAAKRQKTADAPDTTVVKRRVCADWMQSKCTGAVTNGACAQGSHKCGDIGTLKYLNKVRKMGLSEDDLQKLPSKWGCREPFFFKGLRAGESIRN